MHKQLMRIASLAVAITFQVVLWTDDAGLHGCPVHDALPATTEMGSAMQASASGHDVAHHAQGGGTHADGHEHVCTCVGSCQGTGNTPLAPLASTSHALPTSSPLVRPVVAFRQELPAPPAFVLPYSQGPPRLV